MRTHATVEKITDHNLLPEPFRSYWLTDPENGFGPACQYNPEWEFWLVDGELYINEPDEQRLASHWTQSNCAGVANFLQDKGVKVAEMPYVHVPSGQRLFEVVAGDCWEYRTSARLADGTLITVHSG